MCADSFVRRGCELMNYGNCLSLRGGLIIRKCAIGVAILANVLGTVRTKSVGAHLKANLSARHGVRFARLDVVDRDPRRWLPGPPFPAARSSRNEPVRLDQSFSEDRLPALRVEVDDATQLRWRRVARLLPSGRTSPHFRPPTRSEEHTSELQSRLHLVCRLLLEKKKKKN